MGWAHVYLKMRSSRACLDNRTLPTWLYSHGVTQSLKRMADEEVATRWQICVGGICLFCKRLGNAVCDCICWSPLPPAGFATCSRYHLIVKNNIIWETKRIDDWTWRRQRRRRRQRRGRDLFMRMSLSSGQLRWTHIFDIKLSMMKHNKLSLSSSLIESHCC